MPSRPPSASSCRPPAFFEALGVRYVGPFDGHDIEELEHALRNAEALSAEGPIVVHVLTQKGKGYSPAEDDDEKHLHDAPVFDPAVGPPKAVPTGYNPGLRRGDHQGSRGRPRVVAITAAMPGPTGLLPFEPASRSGSSTSASRAGAVTGAAGMAACGRRRPLLHLPHLPQPTGRLRRGPAPTPGGVLSRPRRDHR